MMSLTIIGAYQIVALLLASSVLFFLYAYYLYYIVLKDRGEPNKDFTPLIKFLYYFYFVVYPYMNLFITMYVNKRRKGFKSTGTKEYRFSEATRHYTRHNELLHVAMILAHFIVAFISARYWLL